MSRRRVKIAAAAALVAGLGSAAFWSSRQALPETGDTAARSQLTLRVDLSDRTLAAEIDGLVEGTYDVTVGTDAHPTPRGEFAVRRVIWNPGWVPPKVTWARGRKPVEPGDPANPMGRVKMFFRDPDYFIHGTNDEKSIGRAASHGCVRMRNDDIIALAQVVMEHGGEPREPGWFQRVLNRVRSTSEVHLTMPVTVEITE